jgi:phospholipase C
VNLHIESAAAAQHLGYFRHPKIALRSFLPTSLTAVVAAFFALSCGGGSGMSSPTSPDPPLGAPSAHVVLLLEENHSFSQVIGNSAMPYLNSLASQYGLATQYYANTHSSIGNYFMLTTGIIETNDDSFTGIVSDDNLVRRLVAGGKSWKSYAGSLPSVGYTGGDAFPYLKRHNPFAYLADVVNDPAQAANLVPFTQFSADLAANRLPDFSYIVPDALEDAHDGSLAHADAWLQQNIAPLIASSQFQADGLLIITFDEGDASDSTHGGGHIATIIVSPKGKPGFQSQTFFQHQSTLRLILSSLGISSFPGASASAPTLDEFLASH